MFFILLGELGKKKLSSNTLSFILVFVFFSAIAPDIIFLFLFFCGVVLLYRAVCAVFPTPIQEEAAVFCRHRSFIKKQSENTIKVV